MPGRSYVSRVLLPVELSRADRTYVFQGRSYGRQARGGQVSGGVFECGAARLVQRLDELASRVAGLQVRGEPAGRADRVDERLPSGVGRCGRHWRRRGGRRVVQECGGRPGCSDRAAQREAGGGGVGRVRRRRGGRPRFGVGEGGVDGLAAAVAAGCGAPDLHLATVQHGLDLRRRGRRWGQRLGLAAGSAASGSTA